MSSVAKRELISLGTSLRILVTAEESQNEFSMVEMVMPAGFLGAPVHYHEFLSETFYVIEGTLRVTRDAETFDLRAGDVAVIPAGARHSLRNVSDAPVRVLEVANPGGHDRFFSELIEWMEREPQWPPQDRQKLIDFGLRHDTYYE